jgi:hypothetical protein
MARSSQLASTLCIVIQGVAIVLGFAVLVAWPPRRGEFLLVPVSANAVASLLPTAVAGHALLIGAGPLPHSYVVRGERSQLAWMMLSHGIVPLAGSAAACGEIAPDAGAEA